MDIDFGGLVFWALAMWATAPRRAPVLPRLSLRELFVRSPRTNP